MIIWLNGAFGSGKTTCAFEIHRSIDYVVEEIAKRSGATLLPDKRTYLKKGIDRVITLIKHIR